MTTAFIFSSCSKLPTSENPAEIITIELNNPEVTLINRLFELGESAAIFEERKNERYKIFFTDNPNNMIIKLTQLFG